MKKIVIYVLLCLFGLGTALNVLTLSNMLSNIWALVGFVVVMLINVIYSLLLPRTVPIRNFLSKSMTALYIVLAVAYTITYAFILANIVFL